MQRRTYLAALGSAGLAGLAGCTAVADLSEEFLDDSAEYDIGMTRNEFVPDEYEVSVGETVVWKNTSGSLHTVTAYEGGIPDDAEFFATGGFDDLVEAHEAWEDDLGGGFDSRETFEHTFEVPGEYRYFCIPHEVGGMVGTIHVTE